ncbi:MAG: LemA family protein [bacterium]|nr:LemA family protein [bacterium]
MLTLYIILGVIVIIALWLVLAYNGLVRLSQQVLEAASDIDVQLKRRFDLIPNLMESVKGYMAHERQTLERVTEARTRFMSAKSTKEQLAADNMLSNTLKTLFAVSENYPDLKANANFLDLQRELADTENKIQAARRFYNANVRDLNIATQQFPTNVIARTFGFREMEFFEAEGPEEREPVRVRF